jgi:hypothetical protein
VNVFAILANGRRSYRLTYRDSRGVVSVWLPTKYAQRMLRNLAGMTP